MALKIEHNEDEKALKAFLLDIDCLDPLLEWTSKFNLFDVLKITRTEIRHSNMLSCTQPIIGMLSKNRKRVASEIVPDTIRDIKYIIVQYNVKR